MTHEKSRIRQTLFITSCDGLKTNHNSDLHISLCWMAKKIIKCLKKCQRDFFGLRTWTFFCEYCDWFG